MEPQDVPRTEIIQAFYKVLRKETHMFRLNNLALSSENADLAVHLLLDYPEKWTAFVLNKCRPALNDPTAWNEAFKRLLASANLNHFSLCSCKLGASGIGQALHGLRENNTLNALDLHDNHIQGVQGGMIIGCMLQEMESLSQLRISSNPLRNNGMTAMAPGLRLSLLTCLVLSNCKTGDRGFEVLADAMQHGTLHCSIVKLDLEGNRITGNSLPGMKSMLDCPNFRALILRRNRKLFIRSKDVETFGQVIASNNSLKLLNIEHCGLRPDDMRCFWKCIKQNTGLGKCHLNRDHEDAVKEIMDRNHILREARGTVKVTKIKPALLSKGWIAFKLRTMTQATSGCSGMYFLLQSPTPNGRTWLTEMAN